MNGRVLWTYAFMDRPYGLFGQTDVGRTALARGTRWTVMQDPAV